jgi:hypothetical protein
LERSLTHNDTIPNDKEKDALDDLMDFAPKIENHLGENYEELERKEEDVKPPSLELKNLEENLRYEFIDEKGKCPVIINKNLPDEESKKLITTLSNHKKAFGVYS